MTDAELVTIGKLVDLCREKRVRVLVNDGFRIELELGLVADTSPPEKASADVELCRCGHPQHMHTNGQCLVACAESVCVGPEVKT